MKNISQSIIKIFVSAFLVLLIGSSLVFSVSAAAYTKIADVYLADKFLSDDTQAASFTNANRYIGVNQAPVTGNSYLDKIDKKQGETSLAQKASSGGLGLAFWMSSDKFSPENGGSPVNIDAYKNPALHLWIFVSNNKAIGGDRSTKDNSYGSIQIDIGNSIGGGFNGDATRNFWIEADSLTNGWNELVIPVKPNFLPGKKTFIFDGKKIGINFSSNFNFSNINWFRINIVTKSALLVKIDDIYFCDLGTVTNNTDTGETVKSQAISQAVSGTASVASQTITSESISSSDVSLQDSTSNTNSSESSLEPKAVANSNVPIIIGFVIAGIAIMGMGAALLYLLVIKKKA